MMFWDRLCCRWVAWHGTARAWRALPHAVVTTACVVCSGPMRALPVPAGGVMPPAHVQAMAPAWPPMGAFLPGYGGGFSGGAAEGFAELVTGGIPSLPGGVENAASVPSRPVPEPAALALLGVDVVLVGIGRKVRR